jgi:hypothetical protein
LRSVGTRWGKAAHWGEEEIGLYCVRGDEAN